MLYEPRLHVVLYQPDIPQNTGNVGRSRTQRLLRRAEAVGRAWVPEAIRRGIRAAWPH